MRCGRCGRWCRKLRAERGPGGRLVLDWCRDCLAEAHLEALGLLPHDRTSRRRMRPGPAPSIPDPEIIPGSAGPEHRLQGFRGLGFLLMGWGVLFDLAGLGIWVGLGPIDDGFAGARLARTSVVLGAGGLLGIVGGWLGLSTVGKGPRLRAFGRASRVAAIGLGLAALLLAAWAARRPVRERWPVADLDAATAVKATPGTPETPRPIRPGPLQ